MIRCLVTFFFVTIIFDAFCQKSPNAALESEVQEVLQMFKERPRPIEKIRERVYQIENDYDLDCVQKGRVFQKLGSVIYMESKVELYPEGISILRDSTLKAWTKCDSLDTKWMWTPIYVLLKYYEYENRLFEAGELMDYVDAHPEIHNGKSMSHHFSMNKYFGSLRGELGDKVAAEQYFKKAEAIYDSIDYDWYKFDFLGRYGNYLYDAGNSQASLAQFEKAKPLREVTEDSLLWFCNIMSPLIKLEKYADLAKIITTQSHLVSDTLQADNYRSYAYHQMIRYYIQVDSLEKAKQALDAMEMLIKKDDSNRTMKSDFLRMKAKLFAQKGLFENADETYELAVRSQLIRMSEGNNLLDFESEENIVIDYETLTLVLEDWFDSKLKAFSISKEKAVLDQGLNIVVQLDILLNKNRSELMSEFSKLSQLEHSYSIYEKAIAACVAYGALSQDEFYLKKALNWSVSQKSNVLSGLNSTKHIYRKTLDSLDYKELGNIEQSKRAIENALIREDGYTEELNDQYLSSRSEELKFRNKLFAKYPDLKDQLNYGKEKLEIDDFQSSLKSNQVIIDFFFGSQNLFVFFMTHDRLTSHKIEVSRELIQLIEDIEQDLVGFSNLDQVKSNSKTLGDFIFNDQLAMLTSEYDELMVLPDGKMYNIPLEMLWDGEDYLINHFDISYLYGFNYHLGHSHKHYDDYIGFGTSYTGKLNHVLKEKLVLENVNMPPLSFAVNEINNSAKEFNGQVYIDRGATKENFCAQASQITGVIHTALHGLVLNENVTCLIFDDSDADPFLKSNEIYDLDLSNELTILSACYSSTGKIFKGEGVRNLARSFLYAGSQSVIPSLWASSDVSNDELMTTFFSNLKRTKDASKSLTEAKRDYLKNASPAYAHPAYWSNMILVDQLDSNGTRSNGLMFLFFALLSFLIFLAYYFFRK